MGRSFWISLVLVVVAMVGWMVNSNRLTSQLRITNANAAMYELAAEIMQFRTQHGQLPDQLASKNTPRTDSSNFLELDDPFADYRQRWPNVKLVDGMEHPSNTGTTIIYSPGVNEFDLMVYNGDRLVNQRKYN